MKIPMNVLDKIKRRSYISWSKRTVPSSSVFPRRWAEYQRVELRSPDPSTNTYLAFALIIYAVLDGIRNKTELPAPADINLYRADKDTLARFGQTSERL